MDGRTAVGPAAGRAALHPYSSVIRSGQLATLFSSLIGKQKERTLKELLKKMDVEERGGGKARRKNEQKIISSTRALLKCLIA
jgi:hypothetical protein